MDLGSASANGFAVGFHVEQIEFKDRAMVTLGISHATGMNVTPAAIADSNVVISTTGANAILGPFGYWRMKTGTARKFVAPRFAFAEPVPQPIPRSPFTSQW